MPTPTETAEVAPQVQIAVSTSREHNELIVSPQTEDYEVYELGMRAVNGCKIDPREIDQEAFEAANDRIEGSTVLKAPDADRVWEAFAKQGELAKAMAGIGFEIVDDQGRRIR